MLSSVSLTRNHHARDRNAGDPHRVGILHRPEFTITLLRNSKGHPGEMVPLVHSHKLIRLSDDWCILALSPVDERKELMNMASVAVDLKAPDFELPDSN